MRALTARTICSLEGDTIKKHLVIAILAAFFVVTVAPAASASHQWLNYHWKRNNPQVTIRLLDSTTLRTTITPAVRADWDASSEHIVVRDEVGNDAQTRKDCPRPNRYRRVRVCNFNYGFAGDKAGEAQVWTFTGTSHIAYGVAKIEGDKLSTDTLKRSIVCQEVGHNLGLDHRLPTATGTCMRQAAGYASPDGHDYDQLRDITHAHNKNEATTDPVLDDTVDVAVDPCTDQLGVDVCLTNIMLGKSGKFTITTYSFFVNAPVGRFPGTLSRQAL